jgi:hypothetical protein
MRTTLLTLTIAGLIAAPAGAAAAALHVIASSRSSGEYAATSVAGRGKAPIYARAYGKQLSLTAATTCTRGASVGTKTTRVQHPVAGRLYRLRTAFAGECGASATLSGRGPIRLQLLATR